MELWLELILLDHVDTPNASGTLCCTNKVVRKYMSDHCYQVVRWMNLFWLPTLNPHKVDDLRVMGIRLLQRIQHRLYSMLENNAEQLASSKTLLVVAPRRMGKTALVAAIAAALWLGNRRVLKISTCKRIAVLKILMCKRIVNSWALIWSSDP